MQYRKELLRQLPAMDVLLQCDEAAKLIDDTPIKPFYMHLDSNRFCAK